MQPSAKCPICRNNAAMTSSMNDTHSMKCDVCGRYRITVEAVIGLEQESIGTRALLSGFVRDRNLDKVDPLITSDNLPSIIQMAPRRVPDKTAKLLSALERRSKHFGQWHTLTEKTDYPLAYARNVEEFTAILRYAHERRFIEDEPTTSGPYVTLRAEGLAELETRQRSNIDSEKAFVAMSFTVEMKPVYEDQIEPAIEAAGYRAVRIDQEEFIGDVVDRIRAEIRESRFVVADFTGHREGVYFESGFALGLSLPVIWTCRKDEIGKSHFDTSHFNHIVWDPGEGDLKERLKNRILAVIGRGPLQVRGS